MSPYAFKDPTEYRVYQGLYRLISPGSAMFFQDACELLSRDEPLQTTTHLVGHLCREIESALRGVLGSLVPKEQGGILAWSRGRRWPARLLRPTLEMCRRAPRANEDPEDHRKRVRSILAALEIEEGSDVGQAWLSLAGAGKGFYRWAHRAGLDPPRRLDQAFRDDWLLFLKILDAALPRLSEKFLAFFEIVEHLAAKEHPTRADLRRLRDEVPNTLTILDHFFTRIQSWRWLEPLRTRGFFHHPPAPLERSDGVFMPPWPQSQYLARMASEQAAQRKVLEIILSLPETRNGKIHSDLIEAANRLPVPMAAQLVDQAKAWATGPWSEMLADDVAELAARLAGGQHVEEGLFLLGTVLELESGGEPLPAENELGFGGLRPEPRPRTSSWKYGDILEKRFPQFVSAAPMRALAFACGLLERYLELSETNTNKDFTDMSVVWRPDLAEDDPEHGVTLGNPLVTALRRAAQEIAKKRPAPLRDVLRCLGSRRWTVFRRLSLYLLAEFPDAAPEDLQAALFDRESLEDWSLDREWHLLLAAGFSRLSAPGQAQLLGWILEGPTIPDGERAETGRRQWQLEKLHPISAYLSPEVAEHYHRLIVEFGVPEGPPQHFRSTSFWGPTSPASSADLGAMAPGELVEFLRAWRPTGEWDAPTPEGLARTLSELVAQSPGVYAAEADYLKGLDATYVRGFFGGWSTAAKNGRPFTWTPVLNLAAWSIAQPREIPGRCADELDADPHWGWARKRLGDLLSNGLRAGLAEIPFNLREVVWALLSELVEDPDPNPDDERRADGIDPFNLSINTVRGEAMHAIMRYVDWVRRHDNTIAGLPGEVVKVLEAHLDPTHDGSAAIRAVMAWSFPHLYGVDNQWATAHVDDIFPSDEKSCGLWQAAFFTYVLWQQSYPTLFQFLAKQYDRALAELGQNPAYPFEIERYQEHLAEHLLGYYWQGVVRMEPGDILDRFFRMAPPKLRGYAVGFVGRLLSAPRTVADVGVLERLKALWVARRGASDAAPEEHTAFGWWFASGRFDTDWAFAQLQGVLERYGVVEAPPHVAERLVQLATSRPGEVIAALRLMLEQSPDPWLILTIKEQIRQVMLAVMSNPQDEQARQAGRGLVNVLAARGHPEFRDLIGDKEGPQS